MTPDQQITLIAAFNNISELLPEQAFADLLNQTIQLLNGELAKEIEDIDMPPRGYKKSSTKKTTEVPAATGAPTNVVVPPMEREKLITEWKLAADALAEVKAKEHALRQTLVAQCFTATKLEGSESVDVGYGYQLRAVKEQSYNATDENGESRALIALLNTRDPELATGIIRWKPDVAKKVYKQVLALAEQYTDNEVLAALHAAITIKPGMPQLELVPPKQEEPVAAAEVLPPTTPVPAPVWSPTMIEEE
jgi:hypothetical protein